MAEMETVPIINAAALFNSADGDHIQEQEKLTIALQKTGFLILRNSDLTATIIQDTLAAYNSLFHGPQAVKEAVDMKETNSNRGWGCAGAERVNSSLNPDYKEFFDCGKELEEGNPLRLVRYYDPNLWPPIPHFKDKLVEYFSVAHNTCLQLLQAIATCLHYPSDYFLSSFTSPMSLLRGNFYPRRSAIATDKDFGIAPHTDYGFLTLVVSDGIPGLEILTASGNWLGVNPTHPGDCVVNFGEMLEMWSGGRATATLHRVVGLPDQERTSCAYFFNPNYDTQIAVLNEGPEGPDQDEESAAPSTSAAAASAQGGGQTEPRVVIAGEYLTKRYNETYVHITEASQQS